MNRHCPVLVVFLLYLMLSGAVHAEAEWSYTVRPGDSLWTFSQKYLRSHEYWPRVSEYNDVKNPKALPPGLILRVPVKWLKQPPQAVIALLVVGEVEVQRAKQTARTSLEAGMQLNVNDRIVSRQGSALLELANGSTLKILPNTEIEFDALSAFQESGMVDTRIRLERGRIFSDLPKFKNKKSRYEIITAPAITSVRGTSFGVEMDADSSRMISEVSEGSVLANNEKGSQPLEAGFGLVTKEGERPGPPVKRLPPPEIKNVDMPIVFSSQDFTWDMIASAENFNVGLFRKESLNTVGNEKSYGYILIDERITKKPHFNFQNSEKATFKLVISAVDQYGIRGLPSELEITAVPLEPPQIQIAQNGNDILLQWNTQKYAEKYRVNISKRHWFGDRTEIVVVNNNEYAFKINKLKKYTVTVEALVGDVASTASEEHKFSYIPGYYETVKRLLPFILMAPLL